MSGKDAAVARCLACEADRDRQTRAIDVSCEIVGPDGILLVFVLGAILMLEGRLQWVPDRSASQARQRSAMLCFA